MYYKSDIPGGGEVCGRGQVGVGGVGQVVGVGVVGQVTGTGEGQVVGQGVTSIKEDTTLTLSSLVTTTYSE